MQHPYIWRHIKGGKLLSWGAKSLQESGQEGEPFLCGDGYARIGEGSGTTDVLANAGVDEAWESGVQLAHAVLKLLQEGKDFTRANLEATYVADRRASALDRRLKKATGARNGFNKGFFWGMLGEGLRGMLGLACVHCGGCIWNCACLVPGTDHGNIVFKAGAGGLHSNEN